MKLFNILASIIFYSIFCISHEPIKANPKLYFSDSNDLLLGWKIKKNSNLEKKANFKTIDALKKFKRVKRLKPYFKEAVGYVVFPNVGKVGIGIGGARGSGEVFKDHKVIGSATLTQLSVGFQLGAQAFSQIIFFQNKNEYSRTTIYNRSGNVREIRNYKNDKLEGDFQTYWPNGETHLKGTYVNGYRSGLWRAYNDKGKLIQEESHNNNYHYIFIFSYSFNFFYSII